MRRCIQKSPLQMGHSPNKTTMAQPRLISASRVSDRGRSVFEYFIDW
jgi:hypothetical protein